MSRRSLWAKIILLCVCIIAFVAYVILVALLLRAFSRAPEPVVIVPPRVTPQVVVRDVLKVGIPLQLVVPDIGIAATIAAAGLTLDGAMDIKKDPDEVAWYKLGPRPGEIGSAVIAGHYGWDNGKGSVFNELHTLKRGDEFLVKDDKAKTTTFIVRESRSYDPNADASTIFRSNDGKAHLNLITCEGVWSNTTQTYSQRLVVFADKK